MSKVKEKSLVKPAACLFNHGGVMMGALTSYLPARLCHDSSQRGFYASFLPPKLTDRACREQREIKHSRATLPFMHHHKNFYSSYGCRCSSNQPLSFQSSSSVLIPAALSTVPRISWRVWARKSCWANRTVYINIQITKKRKAEQMFCIW